MRALYKMPGNAKFRQLNINNDLRTLQRLVGGHIETVFISRDACVICNEEGRILGMPHNCIYEGVDFVGPILVVGVNGDEFCDSPMSLMVANGGIQWQADQERILHG